MKCPGVAVGKEPPWRWQRSVRFQGQKCREISLKVFREVGCKPKKKPSKNVPQIILRENSYALTSLTPPSGNAHLWVVTIVLSNM